MRAWRWWAAGLCLAALATGCTDGAPGPLPASPRSSTTGPGSASTGPGERLRPGAERVVDDPASLLAAYAERPGHPDVAAALWRLCSSPDRCTRSRTAVVVTDDGWSTRTVLDLPTRGPDDLQWVSGDSFVVRTPSLRRWWLATADGTERRLTRTRDRGPLRPHEVLLRWGPGFHALDPATGVTHRLATPPRVLDLVQDRDRLWGVAARPSVVLRSSDRGRTWERGLLPGSVGRDGALWLTPLVAGSDLVLLESADGATRTPYVAAHVARDLASAWVSVPGPSGPTAYIGQAVVLRDGRLVLAVVAWSDQVGFREVVTPPGVWVSTDSSWRDLEHLPTGPPFTEAAPRTPDILSLMATRSGARVIAAGPDGHGAYVSSDLGRHWRRLPAR